MTGPETAAEDVAALVAERAVVRQLVRFSRAMDARDWATLREILADDATADTGRGPVEGSDAVVERISYYLDRCGPTQHLLGNVLVDVDVAAGVATTRAYVNDRHVGPEPGSQLTFATLGDYHDRWEHDGATWRLRHRRKHSNARVGTMRVFDLEEVDG